MAYPLYAPCVNINDETVLVINIHVAEGDQVKKGDVLADVETVKAVVEVEAEHDGHVLKILARLHEQVPVGSVMMWFGDAPDEAVPKVPAVAVADVGPSAQPTAKALSILKSLGLDAADIAASGERLTVTDIDAYLAKQGKRQGGAVVPSAPAAETTPAVAGHFRDLGPEEQGMALTVVWHRDHAAAAYLEIEYDPTRWDAYAAAYAQKNKLMLSPLMSLFAYRLVETARETPKINATMVNGRGYRYDKVNLGFTVQAGETLYLTVVGDAGSMDATGFIRAMGEVQRHALARKLKPDELQGATLAFSSMARWNVSRHVPILPPYTSLIVAHTAPRGSGKAVLGASYDHRILTGLDVVRVLQALSQPPG